MPNARWKPTCHNAARPHLRKIWLCFPTLALPRPKNNVDIRDPHRPIPSRSSSATPTSVEVTKEAESEGERLESNSEPWGKGDEAVCSVGERARERRTGSRGGGELDQVCVEGGYRKSNLDYFDIPPVVCDDEERIFERSLLDSLLSTRNAITKDVGANHPAQKRPRRQSPDDPSRTSPSGASNPLSISPDPEPLAGISNVVGPSNGGAGELTATRLGPVRPYI